MKSTWKCSSRLATVMFAVNLVVGFAPVSRAQAQSQTQAQAKADSAAQPSAEMAKRLQELEKEVAILQGEISALKESQDGTPGIRTAAFVKPASQPGAVNVPRGSAPEDTPKTTLASLLGPTSVSGFVDVYYGINFNHPASLATTLTPFTQNTNQFSLNATELVVNKQPDATSGEAGRTGYHVALIYGQAASAVNGNQFFRTFNNSTDFNNVALKEAYFSYLAPVGKGLQIDIGKFVTEHGAEVIETKDNWNYTRSDLFYYAIPFFHFGARAKYTFNDKWVVSGYLVNGWNNTQDNNSGKTYGASATWTPTKKISLTENYMAGPENDTLLGFGNAGKPNDNWRQLWDTVATYSPTSKWSFIVNGDYGRGDRFGTEGGPSPVVDWWGVAGYAKYAWNDKNYFATRYEYYSDPQGFTLFGPGNLNGHIQGFTETFNHNLTSSLITRFEYRYDVANRLIFEYGGGGTSRKDMNSVTLGMIYVFDSRNVK